MPIPDARLTIQDGGAGNLPDNIANVHAIIGVCSSGSQNALAGFSDVASLKAAMGTGPAVEAACAALVTPTEGRAARPVYLMRITTTAVGTYGSVTATRVGSSTCVVATAAGTSTPKDSYEVRVKISRAGARGVGAFQLSFDGGNLYEPEVTIPTNGAYTHSDTGVAITFDTGTNDVGDVHSFDAIEPQFTNAELATAQAALLLDPTEWSILHVVGRPAPEMSSVSSAGTTPPTVSLTGTPTGYWDLRIEITTGGARGTAVFKWSKDGGATYTTGVTTAATVALTGTGLTAVFATGTDYATDNIYTAHAGKAFRDRCDTTKATLASAETAYRFARGFVDAPDASDAVLTAATLSLDAQRVLSAAGMARVVSANSARRLLRPQTWPIVHRVIATDVHVHPGRVRSGSLADVISIVRDERKTEVMDAQRYGTLRTHIGKPGFYVTRAKTFAANGSDFAQIMNCRVMDKACRVARAETLEWLGEDLRVTPTGNGIAAGLAGAPGTIFELDARRIEAAVLGKLRVALVDSGNASAVTVQVDRVTNLLSTSTVKIRVRILPKGYAEFIETTLSFQNPLFQAA